MAVGSPILTLPLRSGNHCIVRWSRAVWRSNHLLVLSFHFRRCMRLVRHKGDLDGGQQLVHESEAGCSKSHQKFVPEPCMGLPSDSLVSVSDHACARGCTFTFLGQAGKADFDRRCLMPSSALTLLPSNDAVQSRGRCPGAAESGAVSPSLRLQRSSKGQICV